jgi:hypothetical protein
MVSALLSLTENTKIDQAAAGDFSCPCRSDINPCPPNWPINYIVAGWRVLKYSMWLHDPQFAYYSREAGRHSLNSIPSSPEEQRPLTWHPLLSPMEHPMVTTFSPLAQAPDSAPG